MHDLNTVLSASLKNFHPFLVLKKKMDNSNQNKINLLVEQMKQMQSVLTLLQQQEDNLV